MKAVDYIALSGLNVFSWIRRKMLGPHAIGVVYQSSNGTLICGPNDMFVGRKLGFEGGYDLEALSGLESLVTKQSRVLVLGSHVGSLAIPLARKVREIVIYEANPDTFRLLQFNLQLNGIDNCHAYNLAVGDRHGTVPFLANTVNSGGSKRMPTNSSFAFRFDRPSTVEVEMTRLADHVSDPHFDLVVMDIEGSEYFALVGMAPILASCSYLQFEYCPDAIANVAGKTDRDLVDALGDHFSELRVQNSSVRSPRGEFLRFFERLRADGKRVDVLALK